MADEMRRFAVYDRFGGYVRDMERVIGAEHSEQLNGADILTITTTEDLVRGQRIVWRDHTGAWHEHEVREVVETRDGMGEPSIEATCYSSICELEGDYLVDVRPQGSAADAVRSALSESRWTAGTVDVAGTASIVLYHTSAYAALSKIVDAFGGEIRADIAVNPATGVTGRSVSLLAHRGATEPTRRFDYGGDVQGIKRTVDDSAVITALYAWGKGEELDSGGYGRRIGISSVTSDGLPYIHDDTANAIWGRGDGGYVYGELVEQDVTDPAVLLTRARKYLAEHSAPAVSYSATVEQFGAAGLDLTGVALGDAVQVVDSYHEHELRLTARVVKLKCDLLNERVVDVTLGNVLPTSATNRTRLSAAVGNLLNSSAANDAIQMASAAYVERVIERLNDMFETGGGYAEFDITKGLTFTNGPTFDTSTMALNLSGAGFRIANSKTSGGDWNWRTFGTGDGFVADEITSGVLKAGIIQDVLGSNYWNLDTGELRMAATAQLGDTTVAGALAAISAAQDSANDDNLIPYAGDTDAAHGWVLTNATSNTYAITIAANTSSALDWSHVARSPEIPISQLWDKYLTFSVDLSATVADTSAVVYFELYHAGESTRFAWNSFKTFTVGTTSSRQVASVMLDANRTWSYNSSASSTTINTNSDTVRIMLVTRTLNSKVVASRWKLQHGGNATPWKTSSSDASATASLNTLDQEDVFNRLTNNGQVQGLYLSGGKVYLNASYIKTGTLSADLVRTGKLLSANGQSYFDLDNSIIRLGTSSTNGTTIEASGQIKASDSNGSYFGTVAAGNAGSGVVGQMVYLAYGGYIYGAIHAINAGTSGTTYTGIELITLKYSKRTSISSFYSMSAANKVALFNTSSNIAATFGLSSESISAGSTEGGWSLLVNRSGVYHNGTPLAK